MSKYKVLQAFSLDGVEPQGTRYQEGAEIELDDAKAAEIGSSYLEKIPEDAGAEKAGENASAGSESAA